MPKKANENYPSEEAQKRFDAALRGARVTGHKPKSDVPAKRPRSQKSASRKKK
jgi:hypothetical protein